MGGKARFWGGTGGKVGSKLKTVFFPGKSGAIVSILPWKDISLRLHILDPIYPSFYLKCLRKCQKTHNFDIFQTVSQIYTYPSPKFWGGSKIRSDPPMCILLKLHYAKFGVSNLFFSKVIEEKPLGGRLYTPTPYGTGRVKQFEIFLSRCPTTQAHLKMSMNEDTYWVSQKLQYL